MAGTPKTLAQLISELDTYIKTNGTGAITGAILNTFLNNLLASTYNYSTHRKYFTLSVYDSTRTYDSGMSAIYDDGSGNKVWICNTNGTTGAWAASKWDCNEREGAESVAAGTAVTFSTAYNTANYVLLYNCYDSNGDEVTCVISSRTASGFTVTATDSATFEYITKEYTP